MDTRAEKLLAFMNEAPNGKYGVTQPTDEQLAAVLPFIVDTTVRWARRNDHCDDTYYGLANVLGLDLDDVDEELKFYATDGYDLNGYDRSGFNKDGYDRGGFDKDGYDRNGYDRNGYNKEGYNYRGFNKDGYNRDGLNLYGRTRQEEAAKLVSGWTKEHLDLVAVKLAERNAVKAAAEQVEPVAEELTPAAA